MPRRASVYVPSGNVSKKGLPAERNSRHVKWVDVDWHGMQLKLRLEHTEGGWQWRGLYMRSMSPLTTTTLREIPFGQLESAARMWMWLASDLPAATTRRQLGRRGLDDDFYREVAKAFHVARERAPRRYVAWLLNEGRVLIPKSWQDDRRPPSADTIRRWRREVDRRIKEGTL